MIEHLTKEDFKEKIFDYENEKEWKFKGDKPVILDWYASWCNPCKTIDPILDELLKEYQGKVDIYKIDIDAQHELASAFGIKSIPSVLFIPLVNQPQMSIGALPKTAFEEAIKDVLEVQKIETFSKSNI